MLKTVIIENRKAHYEYFIEDTIECGMVLRGNEVKSLRSGMASIKEAWVDIKNGEMVIKQMHITPWETANRFDVEVKRDIKLLAHKSEINKLFNKIKQDGYTLVPIKVYFGKQGKAKILVGLAKGKKLHDKRAVEKERQAKKDIDRAIKNYK